ncbi:hypothetical protein EAF04_002732 [Stromatinia cepivora]|nr:hypothetical protein EAF04_002732 [Stromatinia cepivora]
MPPNYADDSLQQARMEKPLNETADGAPDNRPASLNENVVAQEPENIQTSSPILTDESGPQYVTGIRLAAITSAVTLTAFLITLDTSIISTRVSFSSGCWVVWKRLFVDQVTQSRRTSTVPLLTFDWLCSSTHNGQVSVVAASPEPFPIRRLTTLQYTYIAFLALFEFGSLICGLATSSSMLIVGRAIAAMGSAGVGNGALTIVSASAHLEKRACMFRHASSSTRSLLIVQTAVYFSITGSSLFIYTLTSCDSNSCSWLIGVVLGPLIGGVFTEYTTWRWCFYLNLPIGGIAIAALLWVTVPNIRVQKPKRTTFTSLFHELDLAGYLLFAPTMTMFLLALEWGDSTATIIGLFCGSATNLALFLSWEYKKGDSAMIPFQMVKKRVVYSAAFNIFFLFANNVITPYYLAIYFQGVRDKTPTLSGVYMLPGILGQMVCDGANATKVTRIGYYLPWSVFSSGLAAVGSGLISRFTQQTKTGIWIGDQIIGGVERGLALQNGRYLHASKEGDRA